MIDPRRVEAGFNAASRDQWDGFAEHRRMVANCLVDGLRPHSGTLCVLGAGNGNDLDMPALLARFRAVQLVDLDGQALAQGAAGQAVSGDPGLHLLGGCDVTGMVDVLANWSPEARVSDDDLAALATWPADRVALAVGDRFDVVASTCLLSQLVGHVVRSLGDRHPRFAEAVRSVRLGHLRLLGRLTRPGGIAWLVTDLVSSEKFPGLADRRAEDLPGLVASLGREGGLIHGVNPLQILADLRRDPGLAGRSIRLDSPAPWLWKLHRRHYLVWALRCRFEATGAGDCWA